MNLSEFLELISTVGLLEGTNFWNGLLIILALLTGLLTGIKVILMFTYKFLKFIGKSLQNQKFKTILANYQDEGLVKSFQLQDFETAKRDYIVPNCSNIDPTNNDQFNANVGVHQNVYEALDDELADSGRKHILILADSGMGKTTLLINYFRKLISKEKVALLSLSRSDAVESISKIDKHQDTILLLDAFDEDTKAIINFSDRMSQIMDAAQNFKAVLITCRTQFFLNDNSIPLKTGITRVGSRRTSIPSYYEWKTVYLLPFSNQQVDKYIKSTISFYKFGERKKAKVVVSKIPELALRPMLLNLIPDLIKSNKEITEVWELYEFMVLQWAKRERHWIDETDLISFSTKLAVDLVLNRESRQAERISLDELETLINVSSTKIEKWKLTGRSLLNRDASGNFKFSHRSIMEYLFIKAFAEGTNECSNVKWTDMMCELFVSWGKSNSVTSERLNEIFNIDLRRTGLFPFTHIPQAKLNPEKSIINQVFTPKYALQLTKSAIPPSWRSYLSKIIEKEDIIRVYDFATGFTFQFIKTYDKDSEEMALYKINRYVTEWKDNFSDRKWFLPTYSEFKSLVEILAIENMLDKLDERTLYWLADTPSEEYFYLARIRITADKEDAIVVNGLDLEISDNEKIGNKNFAIDIYNAHVKRASINSLMALPISVSDLDATGLWYQDSSNLDDCKWSFAAVEHFNKATSSLKKKSIHPQFSLANRKSNQKLK